MEDEWERRRPTGSRHFRSRLLRPAKKNVENNPMHSSPPPRINDLRAAKLHDPELAIARPQFDTSGKTLASCHHPESLIASCERPPIMAPVTGPLRAMR
ncbi:hypothetical protein ACQ5SK_40300 [Bradyrhizobium japonicum]